MRVLLVDDHELVRCGLRELLGGETDVEVVGEAASADEALLRIPSCRPDVALLDVRLGDGPDGIDLCRQIRVRHPEVACLLLTSFGDDCDAASAMDAGAAGYLLKEVRLVDLVAALRRVVAGERIFAPAATPRRGPDPGDDGLPVPLTVQEERILDLISEGLTNRQIAELMYLSEKTVKNYVSRVLAKLGMARRAEAAAYAARRAERQRPTVGRAATA